MVDELIASITHSIIEGEPELTVDLTQQALAAGLEPMLIIKEGLVPGTVQGDIHEIGKSLVATMLPTNGFQVFDLGVDVPVEKFIEKVRETGANLVGLSALLTTTIEVQAEVIDGLRKTGLRGSVKVIVGGAPVTQGWAEEIGADGYSEDAIGAVDLARRLVSSGVTNDGRY